MRRAAGFTLIEMVLVMLVITAGLVGLTGLFSTTAMSLSTNEGLQNAAQYAQECAEHVISTRRNFGFSSSSINNNMCTASPDTGIARTVTVGSAATGTSAATDPCPFGISCKNVVIAVTSSANGAPTSSITVMLVNY